MRSRFACTDAARSGRTSDRLVQRSAVVCWQRKPSFAPICSVTSSTSSVSVSVCTAKSSCDWSAAAYGTCSGNAVRYPPPDCRLFSQPLLCAVTSRKLAVVSPGHDALTTSRPSSSPDQLRIADEVGRRRSTRRRPAAEAERHRVAEREVRPRLRLGRSAQRCSTRRTTTSRAADSVRRARRGRDEADPATSATARRRNQRVEERRTSPCYQRLRRSGSAAGGTRGPCSPSSRPRPGRPSPSTPRACRRPPGCRARRCRRSAPPRCPAAAGWSPSG